MHNPFSTFDFCAQLICCKSHGLCTGLACASCSLCRQVASASLAAASPALGILGRVPRVPKVPTVPTVPERAAVAMAIDRYLGHPGTSHLQRLQLRFKFLLAFLTPADLFRQAAGLARNGRHSAVSGNSVMLSR